MVYIGSAQPLLQIESMQPPTHSKAAARIERTTLMNRIQPVAVFAICVHPISQILLFARQKIV
ncbi:hypothetical protein MXM82_15415 [Pseudomonas asiatica]|uniref:hypothetical protein n=1 Tax=Pseudomonas asiatica TaxID=2219225 RepID=UPI002DBC76A0|nr:hypothetical protein [Pseudomonas asiatica]MEB6590516.1 hypothetical protein [Pseudomonas asiatica]